MAFIVGQGVATGPKASNRQSYNSYQLLLPVIDSVLQEESRIYKEEALGLLIDLILCVMTSKSD